MRSIGFRRIKTLVLRALVALSLLSALGPWLLYEIGLHGVEGRPRLPIHVASVDERAAAWAAVRGVGAPNVPRLSPYTYWWQATNADSKAGVLLAWQVASQHLLKHRRYQGMHWWHLSGVALSIWLSNNWSTEQLLSKLAERQAQNDT